MEHDDDFFPDFSSELIPPGKLLISEEQLSFLEERVTHYHQRGKYYGEYAMEKSRFLEMLEEFEDMLRTLRRTAE